MATFIIGFSSAALTGGEGAANDTQIAAINTHIIVLILFFNASLPRSYYLIIVLTALSISIAFFYLLINAWC